MNDDHMPMNNSDIESVSTSKLEQGQEATGSRIVMYTTRFCPFCVRARQLLSSKGVEFEDIPIDSDSAMRQQMMARAGSHTVPQIWIADEHIGGCDELYQLEYQGALDALLMEVGYE